MTSRVIETDAQYEMLVRFLSQQKRPFTVQITRGRRRSVAQNRLQRLLVNEIAEQLGDQTPEEVRGYCKLRFGVPILRAENEDFAEKYDRTIKPLPYETKIDLMQEPYDFAVTRFMTVDQKTRYLDAIYRYFTGELGLVLTQPEESQAA